MVMSMHMFGWKPMNHDGNGKVLKRNYVGMIFTLLKILFLFSKISIWFKGFFENMRENI